MKKILTLFLVFLLALTVEAKAPKRDFSTVINESGIDKHSIAISIKDLNSGKPVYELNEKILMHPASVQKLLTLIPAMEILGDDYEFTTSVYLRGEGEYVIKLGADPYLQSSDLKKLVKKMDLETKKVYIDDSIIEKKDWGEGWQWDDDMNVLMPRFNSYNIDRNLLRITVMPTDKGQQPSIIKHKRIFARIN